MNLRWLAVRFDLMTIDACADGVTPGIPRVAARLRLYGFVTWLLPSERTENLSMHRREKKLWVNQLMQWQRWVNQRNSYEQWQQACG